MGIQTNLDSRMEAAKSLNFIHTVENLTLHTCWRSPASRLRKSFYGTVLLRPCPVQYDGGKASEHLEARSTVMWWLAARPEAFKLEWNEMIGFIPFSLAAQSLEDTLNLVISAPSGLPYWGALCSCAQGKRESMSSEVVVAHMGLWAPKVGV